MFSNISIPRRPLNAAFDVDALAARPTNTPAFLFDLEAMAASARHVAEVGEQAACRTLYALKALAIPAAVRSIAQFLDGLAVSSLVEARLARGILDKIDDDHPRTLQWTSPGLRGDEVAELAELCDTLVFNSLSQWRRLGNLAGEAGAPCALRVNPQLSWLADDRYNPCRPHSQLGVPLMQLADLWSNAPQELDGLTGLHFHTNHRATSTEPIEATVRHLANHIGPLLTQVEWLNVGGGYELTEMDEAALEPLVRAAHCLRQEFGTRLVIEPGGTLVRRHGWLVASVVDLFDSDGQTIAVLDTSVAHLSELFEYQRPAEILGHTPAGAHAYTLTGCSCLAGDRFGQFCFDERLTIGQRIVFADVGAYTLSKVQQFNGLRPPEVFLWPRPTSLG